MTSSAAGPPETVLAAFGVTDDPVLLPGGQGRTWSAGHLVFKPVELLAETLWRAEVLHDLPGSDEFRIPGPARTEDGDWVAHGWEASSLVEGEPDAHRPDDVLRAGIAFHAAIADLPRPDFLDFREDPWSYADRVAWNELPFQASPQAKDLLQPLVDGHHRVDLISQVVHGDLLGNVLFADGLSPAIIDWPAYWRPASWASAVAVADALCWYDAQPALIARWSHLPEWNQMLIRALIYRIITHDKAFGPAGWTSDQTNAYRPVIELAAERAKNNPG